jgi:two-component system sensor histidine kinase UhpB
MRRIPLFWQLLAINAVLLGATVVAAIATAGFDVSAAHALPQVIAVALGAAGMLLGNGFLLRRRLEPLGRLIGTMESADLSAQGPRADPRAGESVEVARLHGAFNRMLDRLEAERRAGARAVLHAQEQERQRIAQDLHDEVNQALTAIILRLEASSQDAPSALRAELAETKRLAGQAMEELLSIARELRSSALDDHGLIPALHQQVSDFAQRTGIRAEFRRSGELPPLSADQQLVIYRVTQESLSNVAQHAGARNVTVELSFVGRALLRIADDGSGLNGGPPAGQRGASGGLGLSGMRERALLVGGELDVRSVRGGGTAVTLTMS